MSISNVLKVKSGAELLSYAINVTPELKDIDLPVQGQDIAPIGKLIMSNERYKNAFLNTVNLIALTVISRNYFKDPWETFTEKGSISYGQSVRELAVDIADVNDYNYYVNNATHFLESVVPDVYNYIHDLNFQKFYKTTTSDSQLAMAFTSEEGLFGLIDEIVASLYKAYQYDKWQICKYMLARRVLDGTITSVEIDGYAGLTPRQRVSAIKKISNLLGFMSPNYNPAGLRKATPYEEQILILDAESEAQFTTEVLATSYFRNDADYKTNLALVDSWSAWDDARLAEVLGSQYIELSSDDKTALGNIAGVLISREFFKVYTYSLDNAVDAATDGTRATMFYNPETLKANHWLHAWKIFSTSPFEQAVVFTKDVTPAVSAVTVSPSAATVYPGQELKLSATVTAAGFANKAVTWSVDSTSALDNVTINNEGVLKVPSDVSVASITVTAKSVFNTNVTGTATITVYVPETTPPTSPATVPESTPTRNSK